MTIVCFIYNQPHIQFSHQYTIDLPSRQINDSLQKADRKICLAIRPVFARLCQSSQEELQVIN